MSKEPIIETDRLILRPIALDDAEACFSWNVIWSMFVLLGGAVFILGLILMKKMKSE